MGCAWSGTDRAMASEPINAARGLRVAIAPECSALSLIRGASPLGLPDTLSRVPLRRRAPFAWLARGARSHDWTSVEALLASNPGLVEMRVLDRLADRAPLVVLLRRRRRDEVAVTRVQGAVTGLDDRRIVVLAAHRRDLRRGLPRRSRRRRRVLLEIPRPRPRPAFVLGNRDRQPVAPLLEIVVSHDPVAVGQGAHLGAGAGVGQDAVRHGAPGFAAIA